MNFESFAYWLRGFFEIGGERALTLEEVKVISRHLTLVFSGEVAKDLPPVTEVKSLKELADAIRKGGVAGEIDRHPPYCGSSPKIC